MVESTRAVLNYMAQMSHELSIETLAIVIPGVHSDRAMEKASNFLGNLLKLWFNFISTFVNF